MKLEIIKCKCGNNIVKKYDDNLANSLNKSYSFYFWRCKQCGQGYRENNKEIIILKKDK